MLTISAHRYGEWLPDIDPRQLGEWIGQTDTLLWVDMEAPTEEEYELLAGPFAFHPLALEDVRHSHQRPKIDLYSDHLFLVFYAARYLEEEGEATLHEVELFVGSNYVLTVHEAPIRELAETYERWAHHVSLLHDNTGTLLYAILDAILDGYFPTLDRLAERVDELEDGIFERAEPRVLKEALALKRNLLAMRRVVGPMRDVVNVLLRGDPSILPEAAHPYLQDLYDHSIRIVEAVDHYREMVLTTIEGYHAVQANAMNQVMQRLTVINILFLPLAVMTGFFGMNFEAMPFGSPRLLGAALLAMVLLPTSLYAYLRHKGWG